MRLPNGFGSVYKLKGKRRKPWVARRTVGYNDRGQQVYEYIGYYTTRAEALEALATKAEPEKRSGAPTLAEVWEMYDERVLCNRSDSTRTNVRSLWKGWVSSLANVRVDAVTLSALQDLTNTVPAPSQGAVLTLVHGLLKEAVRRELVSPGVENVTRYVERAKYTPPEKQVFTEAQIDELWTMTDDPVPALVLVLVYTGMRLGELMGLTPEDVTDELLTVRKAKTAAGVRVVPVHSRIRPILPGVLAWVGGRTAHSVRDRWRAFCAPRGLPATAHCARHTCITRLVEAGVDPRIVKTIVGHSGGSVTDDVYTHLRPEVLLEAIERVR